MVFSFSLSFLFDCFPAGFAYLALTCEPKDFEQQRKYNELQMTIIMKKHIIKRVFTAFHRLTSRCIQLLQLYLISFHFTSLYFIDFPPSSPLVPLHSTQVFKLLLLLLMTSDGMDNSWTCVPSLSSSISLLLLFLLLLLDNKQTSKSKVTKHEIIVCVYW